MGPGAEIEAAHLGVWEREAETDGGGENGREVGCGSPRWGCAPLTPEKLEGRWGKAAGVLPPSPASSMPCR